ncbi:MAG TPA: hypothetical protein ENN22_14340 [bacterium]|nr:hypothetical protein [bacterium]
MRRIKLFLSIAMISMLLFSCVRIDELSDVQSNVNQSLSQLATAVQNRDAAAVSVLYANKAQTVLLKPGEVAPIIGWEKIKQSWKQAFESTSSIKLFHGDQTLNIGVSLQTAWVTSIVKVEIETVHDKNDYDVFFSGVLEKSGNSWLFVQTHFSFAAEKKQVTQPTQAKVKTPPEPDRPVAPSVVDSANSVLQPDTTEHELEQSAKNDTLKHVEDY